MGGTAHEAHRLTVAPEYDAAGVLAAVLVRLPDATYRIRANGAATARTVAALLAAKRVSITGSTNATSDPAIIAANLVPAALGGAATWRGRRNVAGAARTTVDWSDAPVKAAVKAAVKRAAPKAAAPKAAAPVAPVAPSPSETA